MNKLPGALLAVALARRLRRPVKWIEEARREFERRFLLARLEENGWNVSRTAEAIGLARESLSRKMRSYKLRAARE